MTKKLQLLYSLCLFSILDFHILNEAQGRMQGLPPLPCPLRFRDVKGFEGRTNDVIYCLPETESPTSAVVYFPGDVQDYSESMEAHRDNKKYVQWSLDNIALLLKSYHPESHIVIVKPTRCVQYLSRISEKYIKFMYMFLNMLYSNIISLDLNLFSTD
ncbi:hypothetical protein J6590_045068 [Homalodisca vitripennis]|nr:hypothetical protein J6590_045068 [Homalodisca vitripennis]